MENHPLRIISLGMKLSPAWNLELNFFKLTLFGPDPNPYLNTCVLIRALIQTSIISFFSAAFITPFIIIIIIFYTYNFSKSIIHPF